MAAKAQAAKLLESQELPPEQIRLLFDQSPEAEIDWIEAFLTIESVQGTIVDFKLFPQQRQMSFNKTGRDITVKGRQTRASSYILAKNLRRMTTGEGLKCLVMTHNDQTTATFRARIKHHLKDLAQHGLEYKLALDNENEMVIEGLENRYIFGSGEERVAGRAFTGNIVHLSELAHWPREKASSLIGGISPSVPGSPHGWFDIESTPNGAEGKFYDMMIDSKLYNPMSRWSTHFYPWWMEPRYRAGTTLNCDINYPEEQWKDLLRTFKPSEGETKLIEMANLDVGQIIWRRVTKQEQDKTDAPFAQEFPETLDECFLTAGGNFFASPDGVDHLDKHRKSIKPPIQEKESLEWRGNSVSFLGPNLMIWQTPQPGEPYVVWVDCAGGGLDDHSDFSAVMVVNALTMIEVARLNIKVAPQELAPMVVAIANYYNDALLGGERDAFGSVCLSKIQEFFYKNLWYYLDPAKAISAKSAPISPWGHPTQIRNDTLNSLRYRIFDHSFTTFDALLLQQMGSFTWLKIAQKRENLKAQAKKGQKDDLVICAAGCTYIAAQARAKFNATKTIQLNETIIVGNHGLVVSRETNIESTKPWLR